ncbi:alpha-mannosidase 2 isoform X1 [Gopherus flavomarginatus]|uniref:alpha-mannosidase 2 isoform X1 n=1 Tax=Gopherus flavomarginatus TaxID=286002 RepID=UPI0021CC2D0F|nr:alpha-mannosidase 2 isoform X1 [Gopherus flavomarginatus]
MKLSRQFTVFGSAIFCVVIFSLYLMLDRGHFDDAKSPRREGTFPKGQLSILQEKIDHLERLLAENNEIISNIRDSVINLSESVKDGQRNPEAVNFSQGSFSELLPSALVSLTIDPEDCSFASKSGSQASNVQMLNVYDILPFDNPDGGVWKQGFDITYNENEWDDEPLQVFVVPHSHNDPGWLKTFDDYFRDQTQHILNNMVVKLQEDNKRKFMWSEISYFSKWWDGIDSQKKDAVKRLIEDGQFEIVTGGWVMPDEASSHYFALIDQLIEGHQWLEKTLGVKPKSGWAVDPFGYSPTMTYLLKRSGFSNMVIQRVHYSVKKYFATQKTLEFFWRQNWDLGSSTDILCHMMPFYSYDIPHTCGPDPKICCQFDFKRLPGGRVSCPWRVPPEAIHTGNVQHRAWMILDQYRKKSKLFRTKVLLTPLGDDFRYSESSEWDQQYQNYQKLFDFMNSHPELHVKAQFGTLSDYFEALRKAGNLEEKNSNSVFPVLSGDFFTYADRDNHYWSGYFTSRPFYKRLDRVLESYLRAAEMLYSLALVESKKSDKMNAFPSVGHYKLLTEARRNLGLFQHHDAITGTSKDWVVVDYGTRLFHSLMNLKRVITDSTHILILKDKDTYSYNPSAPFLKMDDDQSSQDSLPRKTVIKLSIQPRYLLVYNPTEQERFSVVSVYVNSPKVKVLSPSGKPVTVQVSGVWDGTTTVSHEAYQISFMVHLPPLGLGVYQLLEVLNSEMVLADYNIYTSGGNNVQVNPDKVFKIKEMQNSADDITLENSYMKLWFSGISGLLKKINTKEDGKNHQIKMELAWYGTTSNRDKSGAYLFLPDGEAKPYVFTDPPTIRVTHGRIFSEVTCFFHHLTHTVRLYKVQGLEGESLELSNIVDIRGEYNREIAMRISSDVNSQNRFYTDLNGYQIQPRVAMSKLPLQANIYPMTTMAYIQDGGIRLTLHSAQSLGVTSLKSGQLEVIMDRRLMQDDNRGLGQGLQDNKITANLFRLLLERRNEVDEKEEKSSVSFPSLLSHMTSSFINHPVIPMTTYAESGVPQILNVFSPLTSSMPCDMHVVNLRTIQSKADSGPSDEAALILHRKGFDCKFSNKDTRLLCSTTQGKIKVHKLFNKLIVESLIPTSLSLMHSPPDARNISEIDMSSMEINTFRIRLR